MAKITSKQMDIFQYIRSFIASHGYPPTVREIGADFGMKSPSTVYFHLRKLEDAGLIDMPRGKTRAITLLEDPIPHRDQVPVLGNVAAGTPILAEENIEEYVPFKGNGRHKMEEFFALRVRGESMLGAGILPGDLVVVHRQPQVENGQIVVALFEDEATVKTLSVEDGHVWLLPENPDYSPIDGDGAQIIGHVVELIRRY